MKYFFWILSAYMRHFSVKFLIIWAFYGANTLVSSQPVSYFSFMLHFSFFSWYQLKKYCFSLFTHLIFTNLNNRNKELGKRPPLRLRDIRWKTSEFVILISVVDWFRRWEISLSYCGYISFLPLLASGQRFPLLREIKSSVKILS